MKKLRNALVLLGMSLSMGAQATSFVVMNHGIGNHKGGNASGFSALVNTTTFPQERMIFPRIGSDATVADQKLSFTMGMLDQGKAAQTQINTAINTYKLSKGDKSTTDQITLVGHSQGGVRSRVIAQTLQDPRITSMVLIGTPNEGAPAVQGIPAFVSRVNTDLGNLYSSAGLFGPIIRGLFGAQLPPPDLKSLVTTKLPADQVEKIKDNAILQMALGGLKGDEKGAVDLGVQSDFMTDLDRRACKWVEYKVGHGWWIWYWEETIREYRCQKDSLGNILVDATKPALRNIPVSTIEGTDNNVFHNLDAGFEAAMNDMGAQLRGSQGAIAAASLLFFWDPSYWSFKAGYDDLTNVISNFKTVYQDTIVGSRTGDSFIPEFSQKYNHTAFGGVMRQTLKVEAVHGQEPTAVATETALKTIPNLLGN